MISISLLALVINNSSSFSCSNDIIIIIIIVIISIISIIITYYYLYNFYVAVTTLRDKSHGTEPPNPEFQPETDTVGMQHDPAQVLAPELLDPRFQTAQSIWAHGRWDTARSTRKSA